MKILGYIIIVLIVVGGSYYIWQKQQAASNDSTVTTPSPTMVASPTPLPRSITITEPTDDAVVQIGKTATVSGQAVGMFEGNIVIRLVDDTSQVLVEKPITVSDWMQAAPVPWSTQISIPASASASMAQLYAINPSAQDASEDVSDTVMIELVK